MHVLYQAACSVPDCKAGVVGKFLYKQHPVWCRHFKDDAELFQYLGVDKREAPAEGFEFSYKVNFGKSLLPQNVEFRPPTMCR